MRTIVIAAGGTGGHFFPAEALASHLIGRGERVVLMTDARAGARAGAVFAGCERHVLPGAGIAGRGWRRRALALLALARASLRARRILRRLDPGAVVAFGGYPAVAPMLAALSLWPRPGLILHEQNAVLGRANRALASHVHVLALSFEETRRVPEKADWTVTGNPVRPALAALAAAPYAPPEPGGGFRLLVLGGSLGAKVFGTLIPDAVARLPAGLRARLALSLQCRAEEAVAAREALARAGVAAETASFFDDVAARLDAAHLVIARAGASTVAEIAVAGRPAILVPLPGAIDDHQSANAAVLAEAGGGWTMAQAEATAEDLAARIATLMERPETLAVAAARAGALGRPDAANRLADLVLSLVRAETAR